MNKSPETLTQIENEAAVLAHNYEPLPVVLQSGKGVWLTDINGERYLDMMSAYSAASHGHCHPKLVEALQMQCEKLCIVSRAFYHDKLAAFLEKLVEISGMDKALPMNTGAEAVETAIKAVRRWGYEVKGIEKNKAEVIVASDNFHGRTITITSFSTSEIARKNFGPFTPGFKVVPFADIEALKEAVNENTCAVLLEPIQGECGIIIPPEGYLKSVQNVCEENNVLFVLDEIQSGLGRTGKWFAFQHENVKPDGLILGKALGGGMLPISAFLARNDVMDVFVPGSHGSTFGGNPLSAAVGLRALQVFEEENLIEQSAKMGEYLLQKLKEMKTSVFTSVRGRGLWLGVDIEPKVCDGHAFCERLLENKVLTKETRVNTVRIAPPLLIQEKEVDWALARFQKVISELERA